LGATDLGADLGDVEKLVSDPFPPVPLGADGHETVVVGGPSTTVVAEHLAGWGARITASAPSR